MAEAVTTCYRHNDRRAGVTCQRCGRPICPSCMLQASVGFQCPECAKQAAKTSPTLTARAVLNRRPIVTEVLIGLNVAAFIAVLATGGTLGSGGGTFSNRFALVGAGATASQGYFGVAFHEWYRLVTGAFLHAGLIHLGMNMLVLWLIGSQLERLIGAPRYIALYIVSAVAGSFAVMLVEPVSYTVGASGAIFGLLGAAAAYQWSRGVNMFQSGLAGLIVLNLIFTFAVPGISIGGHIGGLIGGAVAGFLMFRLEDRQASPWPAVGLAAVMTVALLFGGVWAASHWAHPLL
jgi:membrane associated rhomboid family serine protease